LRKSLKTKTVSVYLSTLNPLEEKIARAVEEKRPIRIADFLYVSGPELVKTLAIKGLVMVEREFPEQFEAATSDSPEKPTLVKKKRVVHERTDKSALDMWGGATT